MSEGFFLMHRGWRDNPIFRDEFSRADAWVWLIENACWKPTRFDVSGKTITLDRGQICASVRYLADVWKWSKSTVERFLTRLQTETMIVVETGQGKNVITICNYRKYQDLSERERDTNGTASGTAAGQQRDTKEQGNKGTRVEEEPNGSPSPPIAPKTKPKPAKVSSKVAMTADWSPTDLSGDVGELLTQWPPGRLEQEVVDFREYWTEAGEKRPGWDRTFRSRIRTVHERVMRESRNGNRNSQAAGRVSSGFGGGPDRRTGFEKAADRRGYGAGPEYPPGEAGRSDLGDGGGDGEYPLASPRLLP